MARRFGGPFCLSAAIETRRGAVYPLTEMGFDKIGNRQYYASFGDLTIVVLTALLSRKYKMEVIR